MTTTPPVFVTGSSGIVGQAVVKRLLASGRPVRALARSDGSARSLADLGTDPVPGDILDPGGIPIQSGGYTPAVAFDGTNYLVVYSDGRNALQVWGARVTTGGTVLDPNGFQISSTAYSSTPAIAYGGGKYLVTWTTGVGFVCRLWTCCISVSTSRTSFSAPAKRKCSSATPSFLRCR